MVSPAADSPALLSLLKLRAPASAAQFSGAQRLIAQAEHGGGFGRMGKEGFEGIRASLVAQIREASLQMQAKRVIHFAADPVFFQVRLQLVAFLSEGAALAPFAPPAASATANCNIHGVHVTCALITSTQSGAPA